MALVIVGSSIDDNQRVEETHGIVRAYDAVTGALRWNFDPIARSDDAPNAASWQGAEAKKAGAANVWGPMSVDDGARARLRADLLTKPRFLRRPAGPATTDMPARWWR